MSFQDPWLLAGLVLLPALWWLLRATPPAPRLQDFPAIRLLVGLPGNEETPSRTPWWLLALRMAAAALLIVGAAGPVLGTHAHAGGAHAGGLGGGGLGGGGGVLLVIDDGWASARDWQRRAAAADAIAAEAARAGRAVAIIATAPDDAAGPPALSAFLPGTVQRTRLAALRPHAWPVDRAAAAGALDAMDRSGNAAMRGAVVDYIGDGVATGDDDAFARALHRVGPVTELADPAMPALLLRAPLIDADGLTVRLAVAGPPPPRHVALALDQRGGVLARVELAPTKATGELAGRITLPVELRNALARIVVSGVQTAGTVRLLDESDRRRPVGLLAGAAGSDTPLVGALFYVSRALSGETEIRRGSLDTLLSRPLSVLIVADRAITDPAERAKLTAWVAAGGMLIRFAGPDLAAGETGIGETGPGETGPGETGPGETGPGETGIEQGSPPESAAAPDDLLPVALLPGSRALGGAMSWAKPQHLAPFAESSPFAGLAIPAEVTVSRQVLGQPSRDLAARSWATLADGTPLVTARTLGHGRVVLFGVTANADWSNLPLSGLFVTMLERLVHLASGIASPGDHTLLAPVASLDAYGSLGAPGPTAGGVAADAFGTTTASPRHPPGLYGRLDERRALNLADGLGPLAPSAPIGRRVTLDARAATRALGPVLIGLALALLALDLVVSLGVRGLLRGRAGLAALAMLAALPLASGGSAHAVTPQAAQGSPDGSVNGSPDPTASPKAALATELAYVVTGDDTVDRLSREGLGALSDYVNARTAASLGEPAGVRPGTDDLSFYPLIYWPILANATADARASAALSSYMRLGGIVLIDTQGSGAADPDTNSGAGFAPDAAAALRRVAGTLDVPPLAQLGPHHVLSHTFYLLHDFPGRFVGAPVWVERGGDPGNDGVSPVIIGANDWAGAWAAGPDGHAELTVLPGGEQQRTMAYRFGVNLVMYALTGNYKADQVHVPALLQRLGQGSGGSDPDAVGGESR